VRAAPPSWGRHPQTFTTAEVRRFYSGHYFTQLIAVVAAFFSIKMLKLIITVA
jgi:hypothetical protein